MKIEPKGMLEELLSSKNKKVRLTDTAVKEIYTMYKKDRNYFNRVSNAISKICENPEHGEHLSNYLSGYTSKHVGSKVIIFSYENGYVCINNIDKHDNAYGIK